MKNTRNLKEEVKQVEADNQQKQKEISEIKEAVKIQSITIDKLMSKAKRSIFYKDEGYFNGAYNELVSKLKQLFECPLSLDQLENPIILPSGITIQEEMFNKLKNQKDPYDWNLTIKSKVFNRFAKDVIEIVRNSENAILEKQQNAQKLKSHPEEEKFQSRKYIEAEKHLNSSHENSTISNSPSQSKKGKFFWRIIPSPNSIFIPKFLNNLPSFIKKN